MATTKESMKVIAGGLDKKEEPEMLIGGKVIAVEVPDELAEAFERLIGGKITKSEDKDTLSLLTDLVVVLSARNRIPSCETTVPPGGMRRLCNYMNGIE